MFTSAGLRPANATVDAGDDTVIHFWAHPSLLQPPPSSSSAAASDQRRPVVVLIHGFGPDPTWQWAPQVGPLSRHFDLVVPTLLFFGASSTRAPARSDAFQAAALAALLAGGHLPGLDGGGRAVHVVGTDYGGLVAYRLAEELVERHRQQVGKVVLCNCDAWRSAEDDAAVAARAGVAEVTELLAPADTRALRRRWAACTYRPSKYVPECFLRDLFKKHFADKREEKAALVKGMTNGEGGLQLTPLPQEVLIIWGEFDQIFPVDKAYKMKEKLGEKATVKVIPKTGHMPQLEEFKLFNRVFLDFLLQSSTSNGSTAAK
ncbi:hypothetical protein HU200_055563 [Digitaria exilis]|uniref:AB hydrolase-1 domain-containing protein n=1 Tax=Digitaria exilis TaxID=1010633 RepID=A0A835AK93_9POAL|nr:hypothetical protein HU200_055563 [Digitaria exilis]